MRISDWSSDVCSSDLPEGDAAPSLIEGRQCPHVPFAQRGPGKAGHAGRKGLSRGRALARNSAARHSPFHDGRERLSVAPIQYEYLTAFGRLEQCGNGAFWSRQIHQRWLRGDIIVPQIMVRRLKGPAHGPAFRIQRNYRTRIAIVQCGSMTAIRSEEHTSELQSLMRISYAVFSLKKKKL